MAENTKIEWAHHTFNPWIGCTKVGPGCDHCYAEKERASTLLGVKWGANTPRHRTSDENWKKPGRWNKQAEREGVRYQVFCASLADVFDNAVDREWRDDLATLILNTPHLDWLLLTKRIGNAGAMLGAMFLDGPPDNVWIGATITSQAEADRDIPKLLAVPAAKRFLSMEPLLGPVNLRSWIDDDKFRCGECDHSFNCTDETERPRLECPMCGHDPVMVDQGRIDWVIVGGESGPHARPMHPDWARSLRDQCEAAGVPFMFKQWGEWAPVSESPVHPEATRLPGNLCKVTRDGVTADHYVAISMNGGRQRYELNRVGKKAAGRLLDGRNWDGAPSHG